MLTIIIVVVVIVIVAIAGPTRALLKKQPTKLYTQLFSMWIS